MSIILSAWIIATEGANGETEKMETKKEMEKELEMETGKGRQCVTRSHHVASNCH